jgi:hypothetical protein
LKDYLRVIPGVIVSYIVAGPLAAIAGLIIAAFACGFAALRRGIPARLGVPVRLLIGFTVGAISGALSVLPFGPGSALVGGNPLNLLPIFAGAVCGAICWLFIHE